MLEWTIITLPDVTRIAIGASAPNIIKLQRTLLSDKCCQLRVCWIVISNIGKDKSFVDDLNTEQGVVSMRVVLYYDLLRFSPRSIDLFISMNISPPSKSYTYQYIKYPNSHKAPTSQLVCTKRISFVLVLWNSSNWTKKRFMKKNIIEEILSWDSLWNNVHACYIVLGKIMDRNSLWIMYRLNPLIQYHHHQK